MKQRIKNKDRELVWVDPKFKTLLIKEAKIDNKMSVIGYTRKLALDAEKELIKKKELDFKEMKSKSFRFGL